MDAVTVPVPDREGQRAGRQVAVAMFLVFWVSAVATGQGSSVCDQSTRPRDVPLGYRWRGDRCEGVFAQQVAGEELELRSFTRGAGEFDPLRTRAIRLQWRTPGPGDVRVRVRGYSLDPLYGMDATLEDSSHFDWSTEVLGQLRYRASDLGFLCWTPRALDGVDRRVYLPMSVGAVVDSARGYRVTMVAVATLASITWRAMPASGPRDDRNVTTGTRRGRFPRYEPVTLDIDARGAAGIYRLEVTAVATDGRAFSSPLILFHHPGS
jgi:hypothetical protein